MQKWTIMGLATAGVAAAGGAGWLLLGGAGETSHTQQVQRFKFTSGSRYLALEFLDDDLLHFETSATGAGPGGEDALFTTPQVAKTDYAGPTSFSNNAGVLETAELRVSVATDTLCMTLTDKKHSAELTTVCPQDLGQPSQRLTAKRGTMQNAYGLGEQFLALNVPDGDWVGQTRSSPDEFGNQMTGFSMGSTGNTQIPVLYAVGPNGLNYGLFLDHIYKQTWNLTSDPWQIQTQGEQIHGYVMTGPDVSDLRKDYMELVGRPPVPPKKAFGLWVSEYGYDNWAELEDKLRTLRQNKFPVDGFVLDLQWFGNVTKGSDNSKMGCLTWDTAKFPNARAKLAEYKNQGIGIITIEESYISKGLPEYKDLKDRKYLVLQCKGCEPVYFGGDSWWGTGSMMDWTQDAAGEYWHNLKRQPLIDDGVVGHWNDLGEPEMYNRNDYVEGILPNKHAHADYHNLYAFKWLQSIARGYTRNNVTRRPFLLSRAGAAGIQRFGAAMWSGDIGGNLESLQSHLDAQMHMSLSGIDYFGSDVGGFHRGGGDQTDGYTQWFANSAWIDVPLRPHTYNVDNNQETSPDRIGNVASNLANLRQRYELIPYYYSLAHKAFLQGEPVVPPLAYYYQSDPSARRLGSEKLIGRDILVACTATAGATVRDVYLPVGDWANYQTHQWFHSQDQGQGQGQTFAAQPLTVDGVFRIPAYVRKGAILPMMSIDEMSANALGLRTDGSIRNELVVRVYPAPTATSFELYEDDSETIAYQSGAVRKTTLSQQMTANTATVTIAASNGTYSGAPDSRDNWLTLVTDAQRPTGVTLNGSPLTKLATRDAFKAAPSGWFDAGRGVTLVKSGAQPVSAVKKFDLALEATPIVNATFVCEAGTTVSGQSVYVVGNVPELGNWKARNGVKLEPNGPYPKWTGMASNLPPNTSIEWKCIKRAETGDLDTVIMWQPGANTILTTPASGSAGVTSGSFTAQQTKGISATFNCEQGTTVPGQSVYVVGSVPELGNWQAQNGVKLEPNGPYPKWTGIIQGLPPSTSVEWKCIKRAETGDVNTVIQWEPGSNNVLTTPASGSAGTTTGNFAQP